ncbi:MAG: M2 family metallopeptidase, partial [Nevskia sp.]|nr:M2 family metallopeptidase [Nevskia sp.]
PPARPSAADAAQYVDKVNALLKAEYAEQNAADWVSKTFITDDTQLLSAKANERDLALRTQLVEEAKKFNGADLPPELARAILLLKISNPVPAPADARKRAELTRLSTRLEAEYGAGRYCPPGRSGEDCQHLDQLEDVLDHSRDPKALDEAWAGWHTVGRPMKQEYAQMAQLMNEGAQELGYKDAGDLWRAGYDMTPEQFAAESGRLWSQVEPLYRELHCYVRARLRRKYGALVPENGPIPADLLGNMWAQDWGNVYDLVEPYPGAGSLDVSEVLQQRHDAIEKRLLGEFQTRFATGHPGQKPDVRQLDAVAHQADLEYAHDTARIAEDFYTSIGFPALPASFWDKSMLVRPRDREVVCHASAWDMDQAGDVRIKMCIKPDEESLTTIHHELGHVYYYLHYNQQPELYQAGAHDGFHEAIGDTITLSLTPQHLARIGLVKEAPQDRKALINAQMKRALAKIAFLPFGMLIDQWRWQVFSGALKPEHFNAGWWALRERYQGVMPPLPRSEDDFDPGAKYHVPANTPYVRYFLSFVIQFQFQKALCDAAGFDGPLYQCDIYDSKAAGRKFADMLSLGASRPWPEAMKVLTGQDRMDASAITEYFSPLLDYLKEQNQGQACGWQLPADPLAGPAAAGTAPAKTS